MADQAHPIEPRPHTRFAAIRWCNRCPSTFEGALAALTVIGVISRQVAEELGEK